jgi:hypothetical protein
MKNFSAILVGIAAIFVFGVGGYLVGHSGAGTTSEAAAAKEQAFREARDNAFAAARLQARHDGFADGRERGIGAGRAAGTRSGAFAGKEEARAELAAIEAAEAPPLEHTEHLPNGDPGYVLPESERSISCVGYSAVDGECVGD